MNPQRQPELPGCLSVIGILVAFIAVVFIIAFTILRGGVLFSPGLLNAMAGLSKVGGVNTHAEINQCSACHPVLFSPQKMADLCVTCHTDVTITKNFHQVLYKPAQIQKCNTCHTEHLGSSASLTKVSLIDIPHASTGYSLQAHKKKNDGSSFNCNDCHDSYAQFDLNICLTCHKKIDATFMLAHMADYGTGCIACHDGIDSYGKSFDHQKVTFQLTGVHATVNCGKCHTGARSISDLKNTASKCISCHLKDDSHQGQFGQACEECHTTAAWKPANFNHDTTSFPLIGHHMAVTCPACHTNNQFKGTPTTCYACHAKDDAHQGAFGQDCGLCHTPVNWLPPTFDHAKSVFPLTGKHQTTPCSGCHADNVFVGTPTTCYACHAKNDAHKGAFGQDCSLCHNPEGWLPPTFDHFRSAFPLFGKHQTTPCTSCHVNDVFTGTPTACYACHAKDDAHQGQLGQDCSLCHNPAGWLPATFDHSKTSFPLTGAHVKLDCISCHVKNASGMIMFTGLPTACVGCHNDPAYHQGLFGTNCATCHSTTGWTPAKFNGPHTFPIGHGGANSCHSCHPSSLRGYTCFTCHNQAQTAARHAQEGITNLSNCIGCHPNGTTEGNGGGGGGG